VLLALSAILLAGCGSDGGDPVDTDGGDNTLHVSSGPFAVTSRMIFDTCSSTKSYDGTYDVEIDSLNFAMGEEWTGSWNPETASANGESEHKSVTYRNCTISEWTSVHLVFASADSLTGTVSYRKRVNGECDEPCLTTWSITGTREQTQ
jgi:hypothetical protein